MAEPKLLVLFLEILPAPEGWSWIKLTDVSRLETGHTPSRRHPEYWDGDVPWVGIKDATGNHGGMLYQTIQYTNDLGIANSSARILPAETVCLSRTASVGYVVVMGKPMATSQDFVNWVCDPEKLDYQFLKYILLGENRSFLRFASGTTHQTIYFPEVKAFHVCMPQLSEQKAIAHILGTLDDKIELNRQMNATLEAMAQALFKSWFVDFDPVIDNALAAGNPIPEPLQTRAEARKALGNQRKPLPIANGSLSATLPEGVQNQFPNRFVFNEDMGWVPEGWVTRTLEAVTTELRRGISPKYVEEGGVRVINQKCIRDHSVNFSLVRRNDPNKRKITGREIAIGDVLVNSTGVGTLGRMAQVKELSERTVVDSHVTIIRPDAEFFQPYVFGQAVLCMEATVEAMGEGSTGQTELSRANLQALSTLVPPMNCQEHIEKQLVSLAKRQVMTTKENSVLEKSRDTLLPKLLSGQLRIPEAEKQVAEAL
ncbi:MAG: restriction endonuclease subunit S [Candidatus Thiodiazotropha sp. 6PLUC3]